MRTHPRTHTHANTEAVCRQEREEKNYLKNICFPQCAAKGNFCNKIYTENQFINLHKKSKSE